MSDPIDPSEPTDSTDASRATDPTEISVDDVDDGSGSRSIALLAALAVIVVVAIVIAVFAFSDDDDGPELTDETPAASTGVAALWGNQYQIVSTTESSGSEPWTPPSDPALTMTFAVDRRVSFTGCNGGSGMAAAGDDRLVVTDMASTAMACVDAEGEELMAHDERMARLLMAGVSVGGNADEPVLRGGGGAEVRLRRIGPAPEPSAPVDDPDAPVSSDDGSTSSDGSTIDGTIIDDPTSDGGGTTGGDPGTVEPGDGDPDGTDVDTSSDADGGGTDDGGSTEPGSEGPAETTTP